MRFDGLNWMIFLVPPLVWLLLQYSGKMPKIDSIKEFVSMLNSRGGNILILTFLSLVFFAYSVQLFNQAIFLIARKQLEPANAILLMGIQFVTNTAFGTAIGALVKSMTGADSYTRASDKGAPLVPEDASKTNRS